MFTYHIEGNCILCLYCTFNLGLISIFMYVGHRRVEISCGLLPTRFLFKFPYKTINAEKVKFQIHLFIGKTTCVIGKAIKNYIQHIPLVPLIFEVFVEL